ncbi:MAG: hypothetical protein NVSMB65_15020 [Chloroflexota bacterium]
MSQACRRDRLSRRTLQTEVVKVKGELYVTSGGPYCAAARDALEWRGVPFVEYDVGQDRAAYDRMLQLTGGQRTVPVIVEEGQPVRIGWMGQGCVVS